MVLDLVSDMLTRLNNGYRAKLSKIFILRNKQNLIILSLLLRLGYISSFYLYNYKLVTVQLAYYRGQPAIRLIKRISSSKNRVYLSSKELKNRTGLANTQNGFLIMSTTCGIITDIEASAYGVGGEILFQIL